VKRREFITLLGGAAAWPLAARAQQGKPMRRIGALMGVANDSEGQIRITALRQGLRQLGWTDGVNVQIDVRWGDADIDQIRSDVAELVVSKPDVIVVNSI
jgi:putative ABC transport system substrate-binding protein